MFLRFWHFGGGGLGWPFNNQTQPIYPLSYINQHINEKPLRERDYFAKLQVQKWRWWWNEKSLLSDCIIDLDYNMSRSNVKGPFNLVPMNQRCTMGRILLMIKYYYNSRKYVTLTFDLSPLPLTMMFYLDILFYDLDISRSFDFWEFTIYSLVWLV